MKRVVGLDVLRILSMLIVFLFHSKLNYNCNYGIFNDFIGMGAIFMTLFFILSGFSLFMTYNKENVIEILGLKRFYIKRFISIIPMYYFMAILFVIFLGRETFIDNIRIAPIEIWGL